MEQTNSDTNSHSNPDRRTDSARWRAEAEAANEQRDDERRAAGDQQARQRSADPAATDPLWQRWWEIQSTFVDDPRSAVAEAHALVSGVIDRVVQQLQQQRSELEQRWSEGRDNSTEDLRCGLQGYREFLGRLLSRGDIPKA